MRALNYAELHAFICISAHTYAIIMCICAHTSRFYKYIHMYIIFSYRYKYSYIIYTYSGKNLQKSMWVDYIPQIHKMTKMYRKEDMDNSSVAEASIVACISSSLMFWDVVLCSLNLSILSILFFYE